MDYFKQTLGFVLLLVVLHSCEKGNEIDTEKPVMDIDFAEASPVNCDTLYFGEPFVLKMRFSDNEELGSYRIDIHNNFGHHSHTTDVTECNTDPDKDLEGLNPYVFIKKFDIPDGKMNFEASDTINIPSGNENGNYESGDYHFFISLTDAEGWTTQKGLSIKMLQK